jgi:phosphatidylserine/phosphatidylglycerophosphate/cardiolipin synthase-like enzyme
MTQFLNTQAAYSEMENIVNRAEQKLVLMSPYLQISRLLLQKVFYASEHRGIDVSMICRKKDITPEEMAALNQISRLEIFDLPELHANCIYNEKTMVITSLNLYDYSQTNNRDMGVLISYEKDPATYLAAFNETEYMMQLATLVKANMILARTRREPVAAGNVSFFDIKGGLKQMQGDLKQTFPTFTKILSHTTLH